MISAAILSIGIIVLGYCISYGILHFHQFNRYVSVKGLSDRKVQADNVIWKINYNATATSLSKLYQKINTDQQLIKSFLLENGIDKKNIYFGSISTSQNTKKVDKNGQEESSYIEYSSYGDVTVTTSQVTLIQSLSQKVIDLVSKDVLISSNDVQYYYTKLNEIKPEMLKLATNNAKLAAWKFAENAQANLGSLRQASQGLFTISNADHSYGNSDPSKVIRVVVNAEYFIK